MLAAPAQSQQMLEADVCLGAAVHAVGHAHGHQPAGVSQAGPLPDPPPQYAGQEGVLQVQGGVPREAGQLLCLHLRKGSRIRSLRTELTFRTREKIQTRNIRRAPFALTRYSNVFDLQTRKSRFH